MSRPPRTRAVAARVGGARAPLRATAPRMGSRAASWRRDGEIGRVHSCTRPLTYRALAQLREAGLVEARGTATSDGGACSNDARTDTARTRGVQALAQRAGRARPRPPLGAHAQAAVPRARRQRSLRRSSTSKRTSSLEPSSRSSGRRVSRPTSIARSTLWRLSVVRAALSFVEGLLDQRTVEPVVYRPIGLVVSPHSELDGMPLQPIADTSGTSTHRDLRGAARLPRRSRWLHARLGARAPAREQRVGRRRPDVPRRHDARNVRDTLAAPAEPARALARAHSSRSASSSVVRRGARPPHRDAGHRPEAVRPALRHAAGRDPLRLVREGTRRAGLPAEVGRPLRPAQPTGAVGRATRVAPWPNSPSALTWPRSRSRSSQTRRSSARSA